MGDVETRKVKLLGWWASAYCHRVQLALKLKDVEFEYIEEDLANKSPLLLKTNPVHKKVPVLLHGDNNPVAESTVILEYIDETWKENPILPKTPYERAIARFWVRFAEEKLGPAVGKVLQSAGEEQKAAIKQVSEYLKLVEEEIKEGTFKGKKFFGGQKIGIVDIVLGCGSYWLKVLEAEVGGVDLADPVTFPFFRAWLEEFENAPEVRSAIPPQDKLMDYARSTRQMILKMMEAATSTAITTSGSSLTDSVPNDPATA